MTDMIIIYVPCASRGEAERIGRGVMEKRLAPCYNTLTGMQSAAFWPPETGEIEAVDGTVLLIKTIAKKYEAVEKLVKSLHSDKNPCIFAVPVLRVSKEYLSWLKSEIGQS